MKNYKILATSTVLMLSLSLAACSNNKNSVENSPLASTMQNKYIEDDTTEVLLDDNDINTDDIVKVVPHGDHFHVFTKDGKEHITYSDPRNSSGEMEMVSVVGVDDLKNKDVVEIKKHGDHYHVYTADGSEFLTYENPANAFPNIKIGAYTGHHGQKTNSKVKSSLKGFLGKKVYANSKEDSKDEVVKILKHGDHYHVYTASGEEFITYEDPSSMYPNIKIGKYNGSHAPLNKVAKTNSVKKTKINPQNKENGGIEFISAVGASDLKNLDVVKILKHEDHYHVYTRDGREFITYENPSSEFPNIQIGTYVGSHGNKNSNNIGMNMNNNLIPNNFNNLNNKLNNNLSNNFNQNNNFKNQTNNPNEVVKILKHGDHYHVYTASGQEFITYTDPSSMYPNAQVGIYQGSHGPLNGKTNNNFNNKPNNNWNNLSGNNNIWDNPNQITPNLPNFPNNNSNPFLIRTIGANELISLNIMRIKKHGDHYHVYDDNNREYITYLSLGEVGTSFRGVIIEEYVGSHGNQKPNKQEDSKWPKGVTRIVDHGDHWHLYIGNKEIGVVRENPKNIYPNAEYIVEKGEDHSDINVGDKEVSEVANVSPRLVKSVVPYLDKNLKNMTNFGALNTDLPVYGSENETNNIFYWLHGNHYHAISVRQIIQNQRAGVYGDNSAEDVVATLKYRIENNLADLDNKPKTDKEQDAEELEMNRKKEFTNEVIKFLKNHYKGANVENGGFVGYITVTKNGETLDFNIASFEKRAGLIVYKLGELPKFIEREVPKKNEEDKKESLEENNKVEDNSLKSENSNTTEFSK
ncbi:hypothetical protein KQI68_02530 [Peptoniphilus sp. MSJ-1]|uniref:Histidine triad protein n=2 Tax=Peptoniphilus ovalis TaxID=2841503 RepID=A0ABS6FEW9_9FIRM|nr:hypothetical protein [Peptoniphilus ovalis]